MTYVPILQQRDKCKKFKKKVFVTDFHKAFRPRSLTPFNFYHPFSLEDD